MRLRFAMPSLLLRVALPAALGMCAVFPAVAQQSGATASRVFTAEDYKRAEKFMAYNTRPLVFHDARGKWVPGDRYLFRDLGPEGSEFVVFDAAHGTRQPAFDHAKLAAALSATAGATYDAAHLPFTTFEFSADGNSISFQVKGKHWTCGLQANVCHAEVKPAKPAGPPAEEELSPDGKRAAFIREYNLWVRDVTGGKETQLTTDGIKDFGYATDNGENEVDGRCVAVPILPGRLPVAATCGPPGPRGRRHQAPAPRIPAKSPRIPAKSRSRCYAGRVGLPAERKAAV